ncbi:hypothetical protein IscW_ISCW019614, partial [Ixodes scapularis]
MTPSARTCIVRSLRNARAWTAMDPEAPGRDDVEVLARRGVECLADVREHHRGRGLLGLGLSSELAKSPTASAVHRCLRKPQKQSGRATAASR